jgi:ABC-2 type transport system permease protein
MDAATTAPPPAPPAIGRREAMRRSLRRELAYLARRPWDVALLLWLPLAAFVLIAMIFSGGLIRDLPIAVIDRDDTALSRELRRLVDAAPGVRVVAHPADHAAAVDAMRRREIYGVLEIPDEFSRKIHRGEVSEVSFFYNAQMSTTAGTIARDVQGAVLTFAAGVRGTSRVARGENPAAVGDTIVRIDTQLLMAFNEDTDYRVFLAADLVPSLLAILMTVFGTGTVARELRDRTLGDWLAECGNHRVAALLGKLLPPFVAFGLWGLGFLALFGGILGGWRAGGVFMLCAGMLALVAAHLLIGATLGAASKNLPSALSVVGIYTAPAFAYSGQTFPMLAMPAVGKFWAMLLPLSWWLEMQSQQALAAAPAAASARTLCVLLGFVLLGVLGATLFLRRAANHPERWGQR